MNYVNVPTISHETALKAISGALEEARRQNVAVSVAVVDPSLTLVAFIRSDGATAHSIETSKRKANTAASTRRETGWMPPELELTLPLAANLLLTNVPGGFPIVYDGKAIGGLGVAGGSIEQDAAIADAAIRSIAANQK